MRKYFILFAIVAVLIVLAFIGYNFFFNTAPATTPTPTPGTSVIPGGNNGITPTPTPTLVPSPTATPTNTLNIQTQSGTLAVKDFIHNGETVLDVENAGHYALAGALGYCLADGTCPSGAKADDFMVTFDAKHQLFNILLINEPLRAARLNAEQFLMDRLGISQGDMCKLQYSLTTTSQVNSFYAGVPLGFSFCAGSVQLQ